MAVCLQSVKFFFCDYTMDDDEREVYAAIEALHSMHCAALVIQRAFHRQRWVVL